MPDPLAHVSRQVKAKVAHGVLVFAPAEPDLVFTQLFEAGDDAAVQLPQLTRREPQKLLLCFHSVALPVTMPANRCPPCARRSPLCRDDRRKPRSSAIPWSPR